MTPFIFSAPVHSDQPILIEENPDKEINLDLDLDPDLDFDQNLGIDFCTDLPKA